MGWKWKTRSYRSHHATGKTPVISRRSNDFTLPPAIAAARQRATRKPSHSNCMMAGGPAHDWIPLLTGHSINR
jgi:hypothetical protein